jgi:DNA-binding LacI/PurR family transcriptional regulator
MPTSHLPLNETPRARAYRQIKGWISDGKLKAGDYLLPEQSLSKQLGVARTTIRSTLSRLEDEGVIQLTGRKRTVLPPKAPVAGSMSNAIVFIGDGIRATSRSRLPGWSDFVSQGAGEALLQSGYHSLHVSATNLKSLAQVLADRPRGVLVCDMLADPEPLLGIIADSGVPSVLYGSHADLHYNAFHTVASDHCAGQKRLTHLLAERGHTRILRCWMENQDQSYPHWLQERDRGYTEAMNETGQSSLDALILPARQGTVNEASFRHEVRTFAGYLAPSILGPQPVTAIMAVSDGLVPYLCAALRLLGRNPGTDIDITGYDHYWGDIRELRWESQPPVATMDKLNPQLGAEMVRILDGLIAGTIPAAAAEHLLTPRLVSPVPVSA